MKWTRGIMVLAAITFLAIPVGASEKVLFDIDLTQGQCIADGEGITVRGGTWDEGWRVTDHGQRIILDAGRPVANGLLEVWYTKQGRPVNADGVKGQWLSLHQSDGGLSPEYVQLRSGRAGYGFSKLRAKSNEKGVSKKSKALTYKRCEVTGGDVEDWITDDATVMHTTIRWENGVVSFTTPKGEVYAGTKYWQYAPPYVIDSLRYAYLGSDQSSGGGSLPGLRFRRVRFVDLGGAAAAPETGSAFGERTVPLQSTAEWVMQYPNYDGNPFDLVARVTFTHEDSGARRETEMFYDGHSAWRFRFMGTRPGRWMFRTQCDGQDGTDRDAELHGFSGSVVVSEAPQGHGNGFVTHFASKWGWQGSGAVFVPQYVMGKDLDAYYDEDAGRVDEAKIDRDIQEFLVEHGFTGFHLQGRGRWFNLTGKPAEDPNPDPRTYEVLETIIQKVHEQGGACHIWMWGSDGNKGGEGPRWLIGGPMNAADKRNLRYLAARLGPIPGWTMGYGFDTENLWASAEELDAWKGFIETHSGWDHLLGSRVGYDEKGLWGRYGDRSKAPLNAKHNAPIGDEYMTWLGGDYMGYTSYRPLYDRYVEVIEHRPDQPSFDEDRFRLRDRKEWLHKDYSEELTRKGLWHSAMAGGVANIWGNLLPDDNQGGSQSYDHGDVHIKDQVKTYATFFRDKDRFRRDFLRDNRLCDPREGTTETPDPAPISVCLRNPDQTRFIFYKEETASVGMDLSQMKGPQPVVAVDTRKAYKEMDLGSLEPGRHGWKAPYRSDWAIAVGTFE